MLFKSKPRKWGLTITPYYSRAIFSVMLAVVTPILAGNDACLCIPHDIGWRSPTVFSVIPQVLFDGCNTDLRKFLDTSVPSISSHGSQAGTIYRAGKAGAQAMAQSERIKASSAANRFQAVSHASMMSPRLRNTELASQWLRR